MLTISKCVINYAFIAFQPISPANHDDKNQKISPEVTKIAKLSIKWRKFD